MSRDRPVHAVLFDLDGTLVDSALDLGGAGNDLRERRGLPPLPLEVFRPLTGTGARGMLRVALGTTPEDADFEALKDEYLAIYATRLTRLTRVFDAMAPVLDALDAAALPWASSPTSTAASPSRSSPAPVWPRAAGCWSAATPPHAPSPFPIRCWRPRAVWRSIRHTASMSATICAMCKPPMPPA